MSSFKCQSCKKSIIDMPGSGYVTGCKHYPLEKKPISKNNRDYMEGFYDGIAWQKAVQVTVDKYYFIDAVSKKKIKAK